MESKKTINNGATKVRELFEASIDDSESRTVIRGLNLIGERFEGLRLSCVDFIDCDLSGSEFIECDLRGSTFDTSRMHKVTVIRSHIFACSFPKDDPSIKLENCCREIVGSITPTVDLKPHQLIGSIGKAVATLNLLSTEKILAVAVFLAFLTVLVTVVKLGG